MLWCLTRKGGPLKSSQVIAMVTCIVQHYVEQLSDDELVPAPSGEADISERRSGCRGASDLGKNAKCSVTMRFWLRRKCCMYLMVTVTILTSGLYLIKNASKQDATISDTDNIVRKKMLEHWLHDRRLPVQDYGYGDNQTTFIDSLKHTERLHHRKAILDADDSNWDAVPKLPGINSYLPHLMLNKSLLLPEYKLSKGRSNVTFVIGIPNIRRPVDTYIINTLESLLKGMNESDKADTLIIVCITEPWNATYEKKIILDMVKKFFKEIESGLIDIIAPLPGYYPDLNQIKPSLNDPPDRVRWRSKQNLDYAYLMLHAWRRGRYYLQLEDDIQASPGYITGMRNAIRGNYGDWFLLQFSTLGFIGRLMKSKDVPKLVEFLLMFFSSKPCDWLLDDYLRVKMCGHGDIWAYCKHKIRSVARLITPSLFQHEGFHSSFSGNVNKLKDKLYGANATKIFTNPPLAGVITNLQTYENNDLYGAYDGEGIYWAGNPKAGDVIDFIFDTPFHLSKILIQSGNKQHPDDIIREATVEILPEKFVVEGNQTRKSKPFSDQENRANRKKYDFLPNLKTPEDTFHVLGSFKSDGSFLTDVSEKYGKVILLRIAFQSHSQTWIVINKIEFHLR